MSDGSEVDANLSLTQEEIDALLAAAPRDGVPDPVICPSPPVRARLYDFRSSERLRNEQIGVLRAIHTAFARHCAATFSDALHCGVRASLVQVEQGSVGDFLAILPERAVLIAMTMEPLPGHSVVHADMHLLLAMVDRLLGGRDRNAVLSAGRDLTGVERDLVVLLLRRLEGAMRRAWLGVVDVRPVVRDFGPDGELSPVTMPAGEAVMVVIEIRLPGIAGMMTCCLPYESLKPVASRLSQRTADATASESARATLERQIEGVPLTVTALLGTAELTLGQVASLRAGDVIALDSAVGEVALAVEDQVKFRGRPGLVRGRKAVEVSGAAEEEAWPWLVT